jgi:hypothetical protein
MEKVTICSSLLPAATLQVTNRPGLLSAATLQVTNRPGLLLQQRCKSQTDLGYFCSNAASHKPTWVTICSNAASHKPTWVTICSNAASHKPTWVAIYTTTPSRHAHHTRNHTSAWYGNISITNYELKITMLPTFHPYGILAAEHFNYELRIKNYDATDISSLRNFGCGTFQLQITN